MAPKSMARREFRDSVRSRLIALREGQGWAQSDVARLLGVGKDRYSKWENREESELPFYFAWRIAALYGVPLEALAGPNPQFPQPLSGKHGKHLRPRHIRRIA